MTDKYCDRCSGHDERFKSLEKSADMQWLKIDELSKMIGIGKNWIIGLLVAVILNLIAGLVTASVVLLTGGVP